MLKPPAEIKPWGEANNLMLHWFGLTDSYYWFDFEGIELLRYSDEFMNTYSMNQRLSYVDYQFSRLFTDITYIIRAVLTPVPDEVFDYIRTYAKFESVLHSLDHWLNYYWDETDEQYDNLFIPARHWIDDRRLDFGYLVGAPDIYFFRNQTQIHVRWISDYKDDRGIRMWKSTHGECVMKLDTFINHLVLSIEQFAIAMETQIQAVLRNPPKNVFVDREQLLKNHTEFLEETKAYKHIMSWSSQQTDWSDICSKMKKIAMTSDS